jgi:hypothetical protein
MVVASRDIGMLVRRIACRWHAFSRPLYIIESSSHLTAIATVRGSYVARYRLTKFSVGVVSYVVLIGLILGY